MFAKAIAIGAICSLTACTASAQPQTPPEGFFAATPGEFLPFVETCKPWDEWDKPAPPFGVHGDSYYVGTCGISAILVTSDDGHILLDSGVEAAAPLVLENIRKLGFDPEDIHYLLMSHEHFDHVAGHAAIVESTRAKVVASARAKPVLESGLVASDDPQADSNHPPMAPVNVDLVVSNGDTVTLGGISITAQSTPGHTPGALSWQWESCEPDQCLTIVYADSLSPISADEFKFSEHPNYVADYYAGLERLGQLDCDILLTPHPSHSRMLRRMRDDEMINSGACAYYAISKANDLETRLRREAGNIE